MWVVFLLAVLSLSSSVVGTAVKLTINATNAVRSPASNITVMCKTDQPLVGCNFRVWYTESTLNQEYPVINFSNGIDSHKIIITKHGSTGTDLYHAEYSGRGLLDGECGVVFTPKSKGKYLLACRGRGKTGGWGYDFMSLNVNYGMKNTERNNRREIEPVMAKLNGQANIVHKVDQYSTPLKACKFFLQTSSEILVVRKSDDWATSTSPPNNNFSAKRDDSGCELTLKQVTEENNGLLWYTVRGSAHDLYFKIIMIEKAPSADNVHLQVLEGPYADGDMLTATCTVNGSRPAASISWFLQDETLSNGAQGDANDADRAWRWPWDFEPITQTLNWKLTAADNGSLLTCRVNHTALTGPLEKSITLVLQGVPTPSAVQTNQDTEAISPKPTATTLDSTQGKSGSAQPSSTVPGTDSRSPASNPDSASTGRNFPDADSSLLPVITVSCVVLVLALMGAVLYARLARRCCFRQTAVSDAANEGEGRAEPAAWKPTPSRKPRAPSPERAVASIELGRLDDEEAVVYAEIEGATASNKTKRSVLPEDTTYAELSFH